MNKLQKVFLILIVALAFALRFYKLGSFPVSIYGDEAAIGYNAYSIAQTGKDEYGQKLPLLFRSFNDFKLPGYIYLDSPVVKIFGLSPQTTRLPSAISGTLAVLAIYFLVLELFLPKKSNVSGHLSIDNETASMVQAQSIALFSALLLAISPWHLQFSRAAFEANVALTIILFGILLLFLGTRNKIAAALSIPILFLSIYFYRSPSVFAPIILISFFLIYKKECAKNLKFFLIGFLTGVIICTPIIIKTFSPQGQKRVGEVSVFSDKSQSAPFSQLRVGENKLIGAFFLNWRIPYAEATLKGYLSHFSPTFLFFPTDPNPRHRTPFTGNFYLFETITIFLGLIFLIKQKLSKNHIFLIIWLFIGPLAAAPALDTPHSLRALLMLPPLVIISAIGANLVSKKKLGRLFFFPIIIIFVMNYLVDYYKIYPYLNSSSWTYGYQNLYSSLKNLEAGSDTIIVTGYYWKPYIFYLYYNKINPGFYQDKGSQQQIAKYKFGTTGWDGGKDLTSVDLENLKAGRTIVALSPQEYQSLKDSVHFKLEQTINDYSRPNSIFLIGEWQ